MKQFEGFPARMYFTSIPNVFFSRLLPEISDMAELKVTLYALAALYHKRGQPRFISASELEASPGLLAGLQGLGETPAETLRQALGRAVGRGVFLKLAVQQGEAADTVYFLNTAANQGIVSRVQAGEISLGDWKAGGPPVEAVGPLPDIFALYEANIGMLTPMIAEELRAAEKTYPEQWIRDAVREAVNNGKRKWAYIAAILERWATEGKDDGTHRGHPEKDADKYLKQRYGHMVQR
ncbi:MAG: DnaD domain protein [Chloroflexi bacterium]|nr:DnaD domain protein [Chloroflexota bacterium]